MFSSTIFTAILAGTAFAAPQIKARQAACTNGIHILVARGTGNDQNTGGDLKIITDAVAGQVDTTISQIVYPASTDFGPSVAAGRENMRQQIQNYASNCPNGRIVLLGYSQGAEVIGDLLTGNGISGNSSPLADSFTNRLSSIVQVSDPHQLANQFLNQGTGAGSQGRFPRSDASRYQVYNGKIASFCPARDFYCANGNDADSGDIHAKAVVTQQQGIIQFIVDHA